MDSWWQGPDENDGNFLSISTELEERSQPDGGAAGLPL
jgi:hypothetical protein